jgi:hypothetical protein
MAYPSPPGYGYSPPQNNGLAVASMIAGILAWIAAPVVAAVAAVVMGHMALGQIKRTGEAGGGMALAGLILGYLNIVGGLLVLCFFGVFAFGCFAALTQTPLPTPSPTDFPSYGDTPTPQPWPTR